MAKLIIQITGDRNWHDRQLIHSALVEHSIGYDLHDVIVVEGEAPGADILSRMAAEEIGFTVDKMPARWDLYGKAAGPIRNQEMVDRTLQLAGLYQVDPVCLAFHDRLDESKGTADMIRRCQRAGIRVVHFSHGFDPVEL